jgi:hypothetical protein
MGADGRVAFPLCEPHLTRKDRIVIVAVFRRRFKDGKTFDAFVEAWEADKGFGVPTRVFNAVNLADEREILSVGFVAAPRFLERPAHRRQRWGARKQFGEGLP